MKTLSFLLACSLSLSVMAGVKEDVASLGQLALGYNVESVKGKNASEIFKNWINDDSQKLVFKEADDMEYSDEIDVGFTSVKSAIQMGGFAEAALDEKLEQSESTEWKKLKAQLKALKTGWAPLINKLSKQGVKFGYTGHGPGYCGVSFVELIIVDEKDQKVYEVYLSESGEC